MKKIILLTTLVFFSFYCFSQHKWDKRFMVETNIFNLFLRGPSIALDIPVGKNTSVMASAQAGKFNWGDIGGLHKYTSFEAEIKKHKDYFYYGGYIKHVTKTVYSKEKNFIYIPISSDRNFKGNALAAGASTGFNARAGKRFNIDFNFQLGLGRFYKMKEEFLYNLPRAGFIDYRLACWIGFAL